MCRNPKRPLYKCWVNLLDPKCKTWLHYAGLGSQVCEIHVGFSPINDRIGVLTGSFCGSSVSHCNKAIASGLAGLPVCDDHRLLYVSEHLEVLPEAGVRGVVGQSSDEDLGVGGIFLGSVHLV